MGYSWSQLEDLFQNALQIPASERENYVVKNAKDNENLKHTVLMMLRDAENADHYFDKLQEGIADGLEKQKEDIYQNGDIIDKYKIIEPLGRGGAGQVYLAERNDQQFEQKVAIKCFSPEEVKENFFENFRKEQQFLANLNHSGIAHILDGGITDDGIHFIIMEYVDGLPIDEYLKKNQLQIHQKLQLFLNICDAINFAHNRLILHLDIKPSNIVVNKDGQVKLLDFGIAQKMGEPIKKEYLLASPFYAAPEQFAQKQVSVATDIYQLGILLHKMLSNDLPFDHIDPSALYNRKIQLKEEEINGEIISIIKTCLNHSPEGRYVSISSLSQDISHFLKNRPVTVHSEKIPYKARKFLVRNKIKMVLSALLLLSMLAGTIFYNYQAKLAQKNELRAIKTNEFLLDIFNNADPNRTSGTLTVKEILANSVNSIESNFEDREFKLSLYDRLINIYTNVYLWEDSRQLAEKVLAQYSEPTNLYHYNIMSTLAGNYRELSQYRKADSLFTIILKQFENDNLNLPLEYKIENLLAFAKSQQIQGKYDTSLKIINTATQLISDDFRAEDRADIFNHYASVYKDLSKYDTAMNYQKKAIDLIKNKTNPEHLNALGIYYNNQGNIFKDMSLYDSAIASFQKSISLKRKIDSKANIDLAITLSNLGGTYYKKKNYDSASLILNQALDIFSEHLTADNNFIVSTRFSLANIYYNQLDFKKALSEYQAILEVDIKNFDSEHPYVADDYISLANCYRELNQTDEALQYLQKAEKIIEVKFDESHQKTSYLYNMYGMLYEKRENFTLAQIYFQQSYGLAKNHLGEDHRYTKTYKKDVDRIAQIMKGDINKM